MVIFLIIIYNYFLGFLNFSESDLSFIKKIKWLCDYLGIVCLDYIIVGKNKYYSFWEEVDIL